MVLSRFRSSRLARFVLLARGCARFDPLHACRLGAVSVEYLMVTAIVGLSLAVTLVALGPDMVMSWAYARHVLYGRAP
jgi:hypothetical protein